MLTWWNSCSQGRVLFQTLDQLVRWPCWFAQPILWCVNSKSLPLIWMMWRSQKVLFRSIFLSQRWIGQPKDVDVQRVPMSGTYTFETRSRSARHGKTWRSLVPWSSSYILHQKRSGWDHKTGSCGLGWHSYKDCNDTWIISGHTFRITGARTVSAWGLDPVTIQLLGRWGSMAVL